MASNVCHTLSAFIKSQHNNSTQNSLRALAPRKSFVACGAIWMMCVAVMMFCAAMSLHAQVRSGTITGLVTDANGAVVVDAQVMATDTDTHETYTTKTTETGQYTIPYLANGNYSVSIAKAGFQDEVINGISLAAAQIARADASLKVGAASATVEVQATTEQLQTDSSTVAQAISPVAVANIPNITQNPLYFLTLQGNVQPRTETYTSQSVNSAGVGVAGRSELSAIGVNGGRAFENDIQLDGLPITGDGFNEMTIVPNEEGIQEVRVISNNFTADYGHGQSVMAMTTKSGTNAFHGEANYLIRNEALNANTWLNKFENNIRRPAFKRNNFGGALEGPIKRNTLFFASSYHYLMQNIGTTNLTTVPTDLERVGNFTQTMQQASNGAAVPAQLYNPYSATLVSTNLYQRAQITPAIVTPALLPDPTANTAALTMYNFYPSPNRTPDDVYNTHNYTSYTITTLREQSSNNRVDWKHGKHSVYGSGGIYWDNVSQPFILQPDTPTSGHNNNPSTSFNNAPATTSDRNGYVQLGDTIVVDPSLFLDVRYGVTRTHAIAFGGASFGLYKLHRIWHCLGHSSSLCQQGRCSGRRHAGRRFWWRQQLECSLERPIREQRGAPARSRGRRQHHQDPWKLDL